MKYIFMDPLSRISETFSVYFLTLDGLLLWQAYLLATSPRQCTLATTYVHTYFFKSI